MSLPRSEKVEGEGKEAHEETHFRIDCMTGVVIRAMYDAVVK